MCIKYQFKSDSLRNIFLLKLFVIVFEPQSARSFVALALVARKFVKIPSFIARQNDALKKLSFHAYMLETKT